MKSIIEKKENCAKVLSLKNKKKIKKWIIIIKVLATDAIIITNSLETSKIENYNCKKFYFKHFKISENFTPHLEVSKIENSQLFDLFMAH